MEDLGKSLPLSESVIEAEQAGKQSGETHCLNCGAELKGSYCYQCGQKDMPRRQNISDLFINFISSFWSFESKFFKTFGTLLFKPGRIIQDYNAGKRETYYHPARMYVFLSFIFFLVYSFVPEEDKINMNDDGRELTAEEKKQVLDSVETNWEENSLNGMKNVREYDSIQNTLPPEKQDEWVERYLMRKMLLLREQNGDSPKKIWSNYMSSFAENTPRMIFLLLPVFALLLKLLYVRRDFYYSEHLIFAVFFYDFLYLIGSIGLLFSFVEWLSWVPAVLALLVFFNLYKSMRKVYNQSRVKTILKFFLLTGSFFFCILTAFVLNAIITLILL
jgi:hypothetical protein